MFTDIGGYQAEIAKGTTRLALALRLECSDGTVLAATTFTRLVTLPELTIEFESGNTITIPETDYRAGVWLGMTDLEQSADITRVSNWEWAALLGSTITAGDVARRKFAGARWSLIEFVWDTLDASPPAMRLAGRGFVGDVEPAGQRALFKMRGLEHLLQQDVLPVTSPLSRARWGDAELEFFDLDGDTSDGYAARVATTVDDVDGTYPRRRFTLSETINFPANRFTDGTVRFTSGDNAGLSLAVLEWERTAGTFTLCQDAPYPVAEGDAVTAQIRAPLTIEDWRVFFGTGLGFAGEPGITTLEKANEVRSG